MHPSEPAHEDHHERLSPVDAAWFRLDRPGQSVDVGALLFFDAALDFERLCRVVEERLLPWRRFVQRVVDPSPKLAPPSWQDDPHFALSHHVDQTTLQGDASDAALSRLVGELMSLPFDPNRPLWRLVLIHRPGQGSVLFARMHHCIGDGFALAHLLLSIGDPESLHDGHDSSAPTREPIESHGLLAKVSALAHDPHNALELGHQGLDAARALGHLAMLPFDPQTLLKHPITGQRRVAWSNPLELTRVKTLAHGVDATLNDVLMTALSGAVGQYLRQRGEVLEGLELRAIIPVNLRPIHFIEEMGDELGNHFGLVFLDLAAAIDDPLERLEVLKDHMAALKQSPEAVVAFGLLHLLGRTPAVIEHLVEEFFVAKASLVATNVPGPRHPMRFAGKRLVDLLFWVPHPGHLGLGLSIMSYAGRVRIGVRSDVAVVPDPQVLADLFEEQFFALEDRAAL